MLTLLLACAPFAPPESVTEGWLYLHGTAESDSQRCVLTSSDHLSCTPLFAPILGNPLWIGAGDFSGDGVEEILVMETVGPLSVCRPDEGCQLIDTGQFEDGDARDRADIGDINSDGIDDIVLADPRNAHIPEWYSPMLCAGQADLAAMTCEELPADTDESASSEQVDLDGDGHLDLLIGVHDQVDWDNLPWVCYGDGGGGLDCVEWDALTEDAGDSITHRLLGGDMDGDGDTDVLYDLGLPGSELWWCENAIDRPLAELCAEDNRRSIAIPEVYSDSWIPLSPVELALEDFDGDGDLDLFALCGSLWYSCENDGSGDFSCTDAQALSIASKALQVGDLEGDGDVDLVMSSGPNNALPALLTICLNEGGDLDCRAHALGSAWSLAALIPARVE